MADLTLRNAARAEILAAANKHKRQAGRSRPFNMRQIQQAVFLCRQNLLVDVDTLAAAGYRPARKHP